MKKILTRILIVVLTLILLCGCSGISSAVASDDNIFSSVTWDPSTNGRLFLGIFTDKETNIEYIIALYEGYHEYSISITPRIDWNGDPVYVQ